MIYNLDVLTCNKACQNGGTCVLSSDGISSCQCTPGHSGQNCEIVQFPSNKSDVAKFETIPALGRMFHLGDLYDIRTDSVISNKALYRQETIDKARQGGTKRAVERNEVNGGNLQF